MKKFPKVSIGEYKMVRSNNFPINSYQNKEKSFTTTIAILEPGQPEYYELHTNNNRVVMFNEHEYLNREFSHVFKLKDEESPEIISSILPLIENELESNRNNLIILNSLAPESIDYLIFPPREQHSSDSPEGLLKTTMQNLITNKGNNSVITLSVISIRADGSLNDELNYEWIDESKYIEDVIAIKQKTKLKVKKLKDSVKVFDLNRQQIKNQEEGEEILFHYFHIKDYLESWKHELDPLISPKIGELYEFYECEVDEEYGFIKEILKKKYIVKINQFMPESSLVMMKISQMLKEKEEGKEQKMNRDCDVSLFLKDCFTKDKDSHITLITQIGTNETIKEEAICLHMDLQIPKKYNYLKNYRDKPDIIEELKKLAICFTPQTTKERSSIKETSMQSVPNRLDRKSILIAKESEKVTGKSFFLDTYSSNEKKRTLPGINEYGTFFDNEKNESLSYILGISEQPLSSLSNTTGKKDIS